MNDKMIIKLDKTQILTNESKKQLFDFLKTNKSIKLNLIDKTRGFYVTLEYKKQQINIAFKYLLVNSNKKLNGMHYMDFVVVLLKMYLDQHVEPYVLPKHFYDLLNNFQ